MAEQMSELPKAYDPAQVEQKWYRFWIEQRYFHADAATPKAPYSIVIPPPNVTGSLHMGHALFVTIQDILIRWRRMGAYNAMWMPGTDHAGIATQMVVERMLQATEGKSRHDLGREEFVKRVWQWKEKHGNRITEQLKVLGASLDWERERFTMDEGLSVAVREAFVRLYDDGLIYRAERLINWCSRCFTALSELEVEHEETNGEIWHIAYPTPDGSKLVVATTRPETMLGDTAVAVHPEDDRFKHLIGTQVELPLTGRSIPVVGDAILVDREFGTGAVKVTPGHDFNDFETGQRHSLPAISILDKHGRINENAPSKYRGLTVVEARKAVLADLEAAGLLVETKPHKLSIGGCQRCDTVVEPLLSLQWFVKVAPLAQPAIEAVEKGATRFVPESWTKTYMHWMRNIKDWCISRQLWWGHRIPVWYCENGHVTASRELNGPGHCACGSASLRQDDDVLDTWFSSALWPFSTLGWPEATRELKTFYPTSVMETGYDILFFWVARMMMMGLYFMKKVPFRTVFLHAIVVDENGKKMSKTEGNVIDPLDVVYGATLDDLLKKAKGGLAGFPQDKVDKALNNIKKTFAEGIPPSGADALRFTLAALAAQGRNIRLSIPRIEGYRHFANKLWNAARFALMNMTGYDADRFGDALREGSETAALTLADRWILTRLQRTAAEVDENLEAYRFNDAAQALYKFIWTELCDWYIELAKPVLYDDSNEVMAQRRKRAAQGCLATALETACRLLHPIMPFITEEVWQQIPKPTGTPGSIMITMYPVADHSLIDEAAEREMQLLQDVTVAIRNLRAEYNVPPGKELEATIYGASDANQTVLREHWKLVRALARVGELKMGSEPEKGELTAVVGELQVGLKLAGTIDVAAEEARIDKEQKKTEKERAGVQGRLGNASFVERAPPEIVDKERARLVELEEKLAKLARTLERLKQL
jgi:valyl-tRNA synthetase